VCPTPRAAKQLATAVIATEGGRKTKDLGNEREAPLAAAIWKRKVNPNLAANQMIQSQLTNQFQKPISVEGGQWLGFMSSF